MKQNKKKLRVMLVCGSGIASSSMVVPMVEDMLNEEGYSYTLIKGGFKDIKNTPDVDLVLATMLTMPSDVKELNIPIVTVAGIFKGDTTTIKESIRKALGA
jgi:galactitol-specific phosphotransferase system IIB component